MLSAQGCGGDLAEWAGPFGCWNQGQNARRHKAALLKRLLDPQQHIVAGATGIVA